MIRSQPFCELHRTDLLVRVLALGPEDPWMASEVTATLLMTQGATADARIWARAGGEAEMLSLVFAEIGCLACWDDGLYRRVCRVMRKGLTHAAHVVQGKRYDPDWVLPKPGEDSK